MLTSTEFPLLLGTTAVAVLTYTAALRMRSWPLWLAAFSVTVAALWMAYYFRDPVRSAAVLADLSRA